MKYIVQFDVPPEVGEAIEKEPQKMGEWIGKWQALNPIGFYGSIIRRRGTIIVDVPNEDAMFEAIYATWITTKNYPEVWPVIDLGNPEEMQATFRRVGLAP